MIRSRALNAVGTRTLRFKSFPCQSLSASTQCIVDDNIGLTAPRTGQSLPTLVHSALSGGCMEYARGWAWQSYLLNQRLAKRRNAHQDQEFSQETNDCDTVLLFEHAPVYTLGRGADENHLVFLQQENSECEAKSKLARRNRGPGSARLSMDRSVLNEQHLQNCHVNDAREAIHALSQTASPVLAPNGVPVYRVERGGEVTFHGPGQLVVYPLIDLTREPFQQDLHWFLRKVEEVVIQTLQAYGIDGVRDEMNTGVWVDHRKVCAVGLSSSRWITTHGFALNICPDLTYFDTSIILPCGIDGRGVTSIAQILMERGETKLPSVKDVGTEALAKLQSVFEIHLEPGADII